MITEVWKANTLVQLSDLSELILWFCHWIVHTVLPKARLFYIYFKEVSFSNIIKYLCYISKVAT